MDSSSTPGITVAFDSTGNIYVADNYNHCIQVFIVEGEYLRNIHHIVRLSMPLTVTMWCMWLKMAAIVLQYSHVKANSSNFLASFSTKGNWSSLEHVPRALCLLTILTYVC